MMMLSDQGNTIVTLNYERTYLVVYSTMMQVAPMIVVVGMPIMIILCIVFAGIAVKGCDPTTF